MLRLVCAFAVGLIIISYHEMERITIDSNFTVSRKHVKHYLQYFHFVHIPALIFFANIFSNRNLSNLRLCKSADIFFQRAVSAMLINAKLLCYIYLKIYLKANICSLLSCSSGCLAML